eukprot:8835236-Pyramimonas_sp.AAC.1
MFSIVKETLEEVVHLAGAPEVVAAGVHGKHHDAEHGVDERGLEVGGKEGRLQATGHGVKDHTHGNQEGGNLDAHAGERVDSSSATKHEHRGHDNVGEEAEVERHLYHEPSFLCQWIGG